MRAIVGQSHIFAIIAIGAAPRAEKFGRFSAREITVFNKYLKLLEKERSPGGSITSIKTSHIEIRALYESHRGHLTPPKSMNFSFV